MLAVAAMLLSSRGITGGGYEVLGQALAGKLVVKVLLALRACKLVATVFSYASGGAGGIFARRCSSARCLAAAFGVLDVVVFGHDHSEVGSFALVGMGAVFAGIIRAPITSVLIIVEMTTGYGLIAPVDDRQHDRVRPRAAPPTDADLRGAARTRWRSPPRNEAGSRRDRPALDRPRQARPRSPRDVHNKRRGRAPTSGGRDRRATTGISRARSHQTPRRNHHARRSDGARRQPDLGDLVRADGSHAAASRAAEAPSLSVAPSTSRMSIGVRELPVIDNDMRVLGLIEQAADRAGVHALARRPACRSGKFRRRVLIHDEL